MLVSSDINVKLSRDFINERQVRELYNEKEPVLHSFSLHSYCDSLLFGTSLFDERARLNAHVDFETVELNSTQNS